MALREKLDSSFDIVQLIYCSRAVNSERKTRFERDVHDILDQSRVYNSLHDITGALMTDGDMFAQIIEGVPAAVESLHAKIMRDGRHHRVLLLQHAVVHVRLFDLWPIAFLRVGSMLDAKALQAQSTPIERRRASVSILKAFRPMFFE